MVMQIYSIHLKAIFQDTFMIIVIIIRNKNKYMEVITKYTYRIEMRTFSKLYILI